MLRRLLLSLVLLMGATVAHAAPRCTIGMPGTMQPVAIGSDGDRVSLHLPERFDRAGRAPLVILLHGSGSTGAAMLAESGLAATADRHGFIVAAPDGGIAHDRGYVWNIPGIPTVAGTIPGPDARDDAAFIGTVIDTLVAAGCVDRARVYVTGLSGGGRMASWLGCVAAGRFAAIAPVVGLRAGNPLRGDPARPDPASCRPSRPMPVIAFAGDADTTNPIRGGGAGYWSYPMHAAERRWATLNGCTRAPTTRRITPTVYEERYSGCRNGADVAARITIGGGHSWVVDNEALWAFLSRHRR